VSMEYVAALDVGGNSIKSALVTRAGHELLVQRHPTRREEGPEAVLQRVLSQAEEIVARGVAVHGVPPLALGVAALGLLDSRTGTVVFAANVGWSKLPLRSLLSERLGLPITTAHDVGAGGVAEAALGAGRGCRDFLFIAVGTGIGGAIMLDRRPYRGTRGRAAEIGHIIVRPGGSPCGCGGHGCLETVSSASAIMRRYEELGGQPGTTAAEVCLAAATDTRARTAWEEAISGLADGVVTYATLMDPERIIIGGGVALAREALFPPLRAAIAHRCTVAHPPAVVPAELGDRAGLLGAALHAWDLIQPPS
jgi:glucokinase